MLCYTRYAGNDHGYKGVEAEKRDIDAEVVSSVVESNVVVDWNKTDSELVRTTRKVPRYWKDSEPIADADAPPDLQGMEWAETTPVSYLHHDGTMSHDWCYDCAGEVADGCEELVREVTLQDGGLLKYRWYRFVDQPAFKQMRVGPLNAAMTS